MSFALGIDLGGSSIKAVAVTPEGKLLGETNVPVDVNEQLDWARRIQQIVHEMESKQQGRAQAIGISAPGLAAADGRSIARMPGRLQGLEGLDWTEFLNCRLAIGDCQLEKNSGTPNQSAIGHRPSAISLVPVLNDAHAALLGEAWEGAARGFQNVVMLTLGTGVGGAAIVDGRLLKGALGRAGHLGHTCLDPSGAPDICGMPGSLETAIGNYNILERTRGQFETTHALVKAHLAGDLEATKFWLKSVRALACAVGSFINILDPEAVIVGGGIARAGAALFHPLKKLVSEVEWKVTPKPVEIIPAELGELAGAYGAAWSASQPHSAGE
jgi:glucokinase